MVNIFNIIFFTIIVLFSKEFFAYDEELIIVFCLFTAILFLFKLIGNFLKISLKSEIISLNNKFINVFESELNYLTKFENLLNNSIIFNKFSLSLILNIFLFTVNKSVLNINLWNNFINSLFTNVITSLLNLKYEFFIFYYLKKIYIYLLNVKNILFLDKKTFNLFYFNKFVFFFIPVSVKLKLKVIYFLTLKFNTNLKNLLYFYLLKI